MLKAITNTFKCCRDCGQLDGGDGSAGPMVAEYFPSKSLLLSTHSPPSTLRAPHIGAQHVMEYDYICHNNARARSIGDFRVASHMHMRCNGDGGVRYEQTNN